MRGGGVASLAGWGVMLPTFDVFRTGTPPVAAAAVEAERLGFESSWIGDHLSFHAPVLEAACAATAAAVRTSRLRIGFGVLLLALRHRSGRRSSWPLSSCSRPVGSFSVLGWAGRAWRNLPPPVCLSPVGVPAMRRSRL